MIDVDALNTGSDKGADICYDSGNTLGQIFGNCGQNSTDFVPCAQK